MSKESENQSENVSSKKQESLKLGGNITLSGFRDEDRSSMVIIKKLVGNHVKKFTGLSNDFESLSLVMKTIHETETSKKYDFHAKVILKGKPIVSEVIDRNLFVGIGSVLKKIESEISKKSYSIQ